MNVVQYLCLLLSEEAHEVGQRASKLSRFGSHEVQPGQPYSNIERVQQEKTDFMVVYKLLINATGGCEPDDFTIGAEQLNKKKEKLRKFTRLSVEQGMISEGVEQEFVALLDRL